VNKAQRLKVLQALGGNVPETFTSLVEFAEAQPDPDALWWIRATAEEPTERYQLGQGPWTTKEVDDLAKSPKGSIPAAVQRYLDPHLSGITYVADGWVLTAAVAGPCRPLLREGASGALYARGSQECWSSGSEKIPAEGQRAISVAERKITLINTNILVEWIITPDGQVHHVDYKEVADALMAPPFPRPDTIAVGTAQAAGALEVVDSTQIDNLAPGKRQNLRCRTGSPLAHLCVEVAVRGGQVLVERS
jgi:hypothetical protein